LKNDFESILLAAGSGKRFGLEIPKQFCEINKNYTVIEKSLEAIAPFCRKIVLMLPEDFEPNKLVLSRLEEKAKVHNSKLCFLKGGSTRQSSVNKGFAEINSEYVFIHDGARPLVHKNDLQELLQNTLKYKAALLASPINDTIKQTKDNFIQKTIPRQHLWAAQTPQAFDRLIFQRALEMAQKQNFQATDDACLVENLGFPVKIVEAYHLNFKITFQQDLDLLKALLKL